MNTPIAGGLTFCLRQNALEDTAVSTSNSTQGTLSAIAKWTAMHCRRYRLVEFNPPTVAQGNINVDEGSIGTEGDNNQFNIVIFIVCCGMSYLGPNIYESIGVMCFCVLAAFRLLDVLLRQCKLLELHNMLYPVQFIAPLSYAISL